MCLPVSLVCSLLINVDRFCHLLETAIIAESTTAVQVRCLIFTSKPSLPLFTLPVPLLLIQQLSLSRVMAKLVDQGEEG